MLPPSFGLFRLEDSFRRGLLPPGEASAGRRIALRTWSGPQVAETDLKAELLEQLDFAPGVYDIMCNPAVDYEGRHAKQPRAVDVVVFLVNLRGDEPTRYLIEIERPGVVDDASEADEDRLDAGRAFATEVGAAFRILTAAEIRTPYLDNARRLGGARQAIDDETSSVIEALVGAGPVGFAALVDGLATTGLGRHRARAAVEASIAQGAVYCDLSRALDEETVVSRWPARNSLVYDAVPVLRTLRLGRG